MVCRALSVGEVIVFVIFSNPLRDIVVNFAVKTSVGHHLVGEQTLHFSDVVQTPGGWSRISNKVYVPQFLWDQTHERIPVRILIFAFWSAFAVHHDLG